MHASHFRQVQVKSQVFWAESRVKSQVFKTKSRVKSQVFRFNLQVSRKSLGSNVTCRPCYVRLCFCHSKLNLNSKLPVKSDIKLM